MAPSSAEIFSKPCASVARPGSVVTKPAAIVRHASTGMRAETQAANLSNNDPAVSTVSQNEDPCAAWIYTLFIGLPIHLYIAATLGIHLWVYMQYRFQGGDDTNLEAQVGHTVEAQWKKVLKYIARSWAQAMVGNAVVFPAAITLLQVDDIGKSILGRTFAIAALIVAGVGLFWGWASISAKHSFGEGHVRNRWLEASTSLATFRSVEFWMSMAAPLVCTIWAIIFAALTAVVLIWTKGGAAGAPDGTPAKPYTETAMVASAVFLNGLVLMLCGLMYRAYNMVNGEGRGSRRANAEAL